MYVLGLFFRNVMVAWAKNNWPKLDPIESRCHQITRRNTSKAEPPKSKLNIFLRLPVIEIEALAYPSLCSVLDVEVSDFRLHGNTRDLHGYDDICNNFESMA